MAADPDNLRIQQQINAAIAERSKLLSAQTSLISDQVELAAKFCKAMKCEEIDGISDRIAEIRAGLASAGKAASDSTGNIEELVDGLDRSSEKADTLNDSTLKVKDALEAAADAADGFLGTLGKGFSEGLDIMGSLFSGIQSVGEAIWDMGAALLDIPLSIFDSMLEKAADLANASQDIARAREEVRKQFGDIEKGFAKEVVAGGQSIAKSLSQAGTSVSQVFGMGPEGTAAAIRASLEMAQQLGAAVNLLGKDFGAAAGNLVVFQKGLGLSGEDMKAFVYASKSAGKDISESLAQVAKVAEDMGDKFGMSSKDIARDMAFLTAQSGKFGRLTTEQMAAASVTVRSFGLELKDVVGIMDQFADFESAATNASKLAQAFGAVIDPMKMMKEENPAKQFEYLRKQMLAAGQDASTMNRAQIKLLATQTGMDENLVRTAFSAKNVGKSYDQIQKEAEKSGKKQKSQQEIFEQLGKSIEKMTEAMQHSGSFMQEFIQGFGEGASRAGPMKQVLGDLSKALSTVRKAGRELGDTFIKAFPGVKDMLGSMHEFFSGGTFQKAIKGFKDSVKEFFEDLGKDPTKAFEKFYENIKKKFFDMLDSGSPAGKKFMEGAKKFIMAFSGIIAGAVKALGEALAKGLKQLAEFIKNPEAAMKAAESAGDSFFGPIMKSMGEVLPKIGEALMELLEALFWKIAPKLAIVMGAVFAFSIAKAFVIGAAQAVGGALVAGGVALIKTGFSKLVGSAVAPAKKDAEKGASDSTGFGESVARFFDGLIDALEAFKVGVHDASKSMPNPKDVLSFSFKLSAVALALLPLLVVLALLSPFAALAAVSAFAMKTVFESLVVIGEAIKKTEGVKWGAAWKSLANLVGFIVVLTLVTTGVIFGFVYAMVNLPIKSLADAGKILVGLIALGTIVTFTAILAGIAALASKIPASQAVIGLTLVGAMMIGVIILAAVAVGFIEITKNLITSVEQALSVGVSLVALGVIVAAVAGLSIAAAVAGSIMAATSGAAAFGILAIAAMIPAIMILAGVTTDFIETTKNLIKSPMEAVSVMISLAALALVVGSVAGLTLAAALAGAILVPLGPMAIVGFIAMAAVLVALQEYVAPGVADMLSSPEVNKIDPAKALAFGAVFALVLGAVAAVVLAAAAIGALIVGTLGLGGVAIAAGMEVIADALGTIKEYVPPIVDALLKAGEGLTGDDITKRAEAVGKILSGLGGLLSPIQAAVEMSKASSGWFKGPDFKAIGQMFAVVQNFITTIMTTARDVVERLIEVTSGLSESDLKGVDAGGRILAAVSQVVGDLTKVVSGIDFKDPDSVARATVVLTTIIPLLSGLLTNIGDQMSNVITQVRTALSGISDDDMKKLKPRLEFLSQIMGIMGEFSNMAKGQVPTKEESENLARAGMSSAWSGMRILLWRVNNFLTKGGSGGLREIAKNLEGFPKFDVKKVNAVAALTKASIEIAKSFGELTKWYETNPVTVKGYDYAERGVHWAIEFAKKFATELKTVEAIPIKKVDNIKKALAGSLEIAKSFATASGEMTEVSYDSIYKLTTMFQKINKMKKDVDEMGDITNLPKQMGTIGEAIAFIPNLVKSLAYLEYLELLDPSIMFKFMKDFSRAGEDFYDSYGFMKFEKTLSRIGDMAAVMEEFKGAYGEGIATFLHEAVDDIRELDKILSDLQVDALDVTIDKLAQKLIVDNKEIQIEHKPINITLNMSVTFKAEEFVKDIFKVANNQAKNGKADVVKLIQNFSDPKFDPKI